MKLSDTHKPGLDNVSPAMIRVLLEVLLHTMKHEQRQMLMDNFPSIYNHIYPERKPNE